MALIVSDRVKETTSTTGTGTYTLAGALPSYASFADIGNGNTTYYACTDGTDWEVGIGTYTASGTTLARTTILQSSNSDAAVNWGSGIKTIFCTLPAEKYIFKDADGHVSIADDLYVSNKIIHIGDTDTYMNFPADETWQVVTQNSSAIKATELQITLGRNVISTYNATFTGNVNAAQFRAQADTSYYLDPDGDSVLSNIQLYNNDAGASAGPTFELYRDSASPASSDQLGEIIFSGKDSSGNKNNNIRIYQDYVQILSTQRIPSLIIGATAEIAGLQQSELNVFEANRGSVSLMGDVLVVGGASATIKENFTAEKNLNVDGLLKTDTILSATDPGTIGIGLTATGSSTLNDLTLTGNLTVTGTVDGRDVSVDGAKLDLIEAGATADQTKADIDALGINADQVDGLEASQFLRSDANDTGTKLTLETLNLTSDNTSSKHLTLTNDTGPNLTVQVYGSGSSTLTIENASTSTDLLSLTDAGNLTVAGTVEGRNLVNDGAKLDLIEAGATADQTKADIDALGIDADQLDGQEGTYYLDYNNFTNTPTIPTVPTNVSAFTNDAGYITSADGGNADQLDGQEGTYYLDYNNFTNTPTIPTNNNQLTNGAGYITNTLTSTDAGATAGPTFELYRNSASPAAADLMGEIRFEGEDYDGTKVLNGWIYSRYSTLGSAFRIPEVIIEAGYRAGSTTATPEVFKGSAGGVSLFDGKLTVESGGVTIPDDLTVETNASVDGLFQTDLILGSTDVTKGIGLTSTGSSSLHNLSLSGTLTSSISAGSTALDLATNDGYAQMRVIRNATTNTTNDDGMFIGYGNSSSGVTRIYGGGATSGGIVVSGSGVNDVTIAGSTAWHAGNDGSGSGLDADLLDGVQGSSYLRSDANDTATGNVTFSGVIYNDVIVGNTDNTKSVVLTAAGTTNLHDLDLDGNLTIAGTVDGRDVSVDGAKLDGIEAGATADQTASEILTAIKTVDGSGSGLDADLLDGVQGSSYLRSDTSDTFTTLSGTQLNLGGMVSLQESTDRGDLLQITSNTSTWGGLQIRNSSNEGRWSFMTDGSTAGIYDDENGDWHIQWSENAGAIFYHNGLQSLQLVDSTGIRVGSNTSSNIYMQDTDGTERRIHCNSGQVGFLDSSNNWSAFSSNAGDWYSMVSSRAPIFYDYNNTNYYLDLTSGGKFLGNFEFASNSTSTSYSVASIELRESNYTANGTATPPFLGFHWGGIVASSIALESSGRIAIRNNPGTGYENFIAATITSTGTVDAPQFRDSNNTGYYADPASTSRLNAIDFGTSGYYIHAGNWGMRNTTPDGYIEFGPANTSHAHIYTDRPNFYFNKELIVNGNTVWNAGNDGAGSGLDADLLDGVQGSSYLRSDANDTMTGELNITYNPGITGSSAPQYYQVQLEVETSSNNVPAIGFHRGGYSAVALYEYDGELYTNAWTTRSQTGKLVSSGNISSYAWTSSNDGSGSGLDADLLDGVQGGSYLRSDADDTWSGNIQTTSTNGIRFGNANQTDTNDGFIAAGRFASGLNIVGTQTVSGTGRQVRVWGSLITDGGQSYWHAGNDGSGSGLDADLLDGIQASSFLRSDASDTGTGEYTLTNKKQIIGSSSNWDSVGFSYQTNLHFQGHNQFWVGAGNGTWFTGAANTKSQASGLAADASYAHDLLITTMNSTSVYDRGITFAVDTNGAGTGGWRLGKWHSGDARDSSKLTIDGGLHVMGGYTDNYSYYADDYSAYYSSRGGQAYWDGDAGWNDPSITAAHGIQIQSGNAGTNTQNPQLQFHQYGYGGVQFRYDGPSNYMHLESTGSDRLDWFRVKTDHGYIDIGPANTSWAHIYTDRPAFYFNTQLYVLGNQVWNAGNDGAGSGLDADLLDGLSPATTATGNTIAQRDASGHIYGNYILGSYFNASSGNSENPTIGQIWTQSTADNYLRKSTPAHFISQLGLLTTSGTANSSNSLQYTGYGTSVLTAHQLSTNWQTWTGGWATHIIGNHGNGSNYYNQTIIMPFWGAPQYMRKEGGTNVGPYKFWTEENDGFGSGLDADLLDGLQASQLLRSDVSDTMSGDLTLTGTVYLSEKIAHYGDTDTWISFSSDDTISLVVGNSTAIKCLNYIEVRKNILSTGNATFASTVDATQFRDKDNTSYYVDPAGYSKLDRLHVAGSAPFSGSSAVYSDERMALSVGDAGLEAIVYQSLYNNSSYPDYGMVFVHGDGTNRNVWSISPDGPAKGNLLGFLYDLNSTNIHTGTYRFWLDGSGNSYSQVSSRAQIFYDSNNTSYYVDPASTSVLGQVNLVNANVLVNYVNGTGNSIYNSIAGSGSSNLYWKHGTSGANLMYLDSSGNLTAIGNVTAYSDIKLKDNIQVIDNAIDKVKQIRGVTFTRNDMHDDKRQTGVIAQEVEQVLPEVVTESDYDGIKSVAYGNMVGLLIEAIKEQQKQIEALQEQINGFTK